MKTKELWNDVRPSTIKLRDWGSRGAERREGIVVLAEVVRNEVKYYSLPIRTSRSRPTGLGAASVDVTHLPAFLTKGMVQRCFRGDAVRNLSQVLSGMVRLVRLRP